MALVIADRVRETSVTTGTGTLTLAGAVTGFQAFGDACANADTAYYCVEDGTDWEVGLGTWATGGTLARTSVLASSNADAAVNFGAGTKNVFLTDPASAIAARVVGPSSATDNAAVRFDATTGKLVQDSTLIINDDNSLLLTSVSADPSAPASGKLAVYSSTVLGRTLPAFRNPSSPPSTLGRHLRHGRFIRIEAIANQNSPSTWGILAATAVGTATATLVTTTSRFTQEMRLEYLVTTPATSAIAGFRIGSGTNMIHRGANANQGGWSYACRWGPATGVATATTRAFVGLIPSYTPTDVDPSTLVNMCGMGWEDDSTNVQFYHNDGSGTAQMIDTGIARPTVDRTTLYDFEMFCAPNGSEIFFRLEEINTGTIFASSASSDIPATTTLMAPHGYHSVGGTSSAIGFALGRLHIELD